ncbi:MAG TPA: carboxypeptidase-like regulatory domain-containing protein [Thermoplasmata archaeon]|nr:carboxypeptidase-like regulatory domain-containing protein [Thermoplasmata archaeon]
MAGPGLALRCPSCGTELRAFPAPAPPTQWFPCPHCRWAVPVVVPRDPPPLYTWEVLPGLYPAMDRPRGPRWRVAPAVAIALAVVAVASAILGGALVYEGVAATAPGSYTVSGVAEKVSGGSLFAAAFAAVTLTENGGATVSQTADAQGRFSFPDIPSGGVAVNVSTTGYAPTTVHTFVDPIYNAGANGITVLLYPSSVTNGTDVALAPFPTLESFLASIDGAAALLGIAGVVAGIAAVAAWRQSFRTAGVIGGGAGVAAPAALYVLGLFPALPVVAAGTAVAAGFGLFALGLTAGELYRVGAAAGPA